MTAQVKQDPCFPTYTWIEQANPNPYGQRSPASFTHQLTYQLQSQPWLSNTTHHDTEQIAVYTGHCDKVCVCVCVSLSLALSLSMHYV